MTVTNPFANVKAGEAAIEAAVAKVPAVAATVATGAAKAEADVAKVVTALKTDVPAAQSKLAAFIKNNAGKIATGLLVAAGLLVWKLI